MYSPLFVDLTAHAGLTVELAIRFEPAPKSRPSPEDRSQANHAFKPPVSYGWDFHPRLIPLGLWQPAAIRVHPALRLESAEATYLLDDTFSVASLDLRCLLAPQAGARLHWQLLAPDGERIVLEQTEADRRRREAEAAQAAFFTTTTQNHHE